MLAEPALVVLGELPDVATVAASAREIRVSWPEAEPVAGSALAGYEVQWRSGNQDWDIERRRVVVGLSYAIRGLDNGVSYTVRVRPAAVEVAEVQGASIVAGEGSAPTAEVVEDPAPLNPNVHQSVLPLAGAVNFEMTGEAVWPATIILPVDLDLVGDDDFVELMFYNESLDLWVPSPGAVLDRERGVITAEVYHLSIGTAAKCILSPWLCKPVTDAIGTGAQALQQHVERVSRLVSANWDEAAGWLREGWSTTGEFVFGDLPEVARQVLDRAGTRLQPWARAWLEAVSEVALLHIEWVKTMTVRRFGYGINAPSCAGDRPSWAAPSQMVPDKDVLLHCEETAANPGDNVDDLRLKLTVNRSYGLTVRPQYDYTRFGRRSASNITVEHLDLPTDLGNLLAQEIILAASDGSIAIPPGGTASLRIPLSTLGNTVDRGNQTQFSTGLVYAADPRSVVVQALLLALELAGGPVADLVSGFGCSVSLIMGSTNADESGDLRAWLDAAAELVDGCLLPVASVVPVVSALMIAVGGLVLLHANERMIRDGTMRSDHRVSVESQWIHQPTDSYSAITAGDSHTCALSTNSVVVCWGDNTHGQLHEPVGQYRAIAAGARHTCAIRNDNTIECWGDNTSRQLDAPDGQFRAVTAGWNHSCAVRSDDTAECWGGYLTAGRTDPYTGLHATSPPGQYTDIAAGLYHTCAIRTDGTIKCWGTDTDERLDAPAGTFNTITAASEHTCATRSDGTIKCWGRSGGGRTDAPTGNYTAAAAGTQHTCALDTNDIITCWGSTSWIGSHGQLHPPQDPHTAVAAGEKHSCAIRTDNTITCWGNNDHGQTNAPTSQIDPTEDTPATSTTSTFEAVTTSREHSCGLRTDDTIVCWGYNDWGQADAPGGRFKAVSAGGGHSCGLRTDDTIVCWGDSRFGQADAPGGRFKAVTAGGGHSCGLRTDDTIVCWGNNDSGQADAPEGRFKAVTAGGGHSCGLRTDDTMVCWGNNDSGQADAPEGRFKAVSVGGASTCGLRTDDTIICWGWYYDRAYAPEGSFKAVAAGWTHSCGLRSDDTIVCWVGSFGGYADAPGGSFKAVAAGWDQFCGLRSDDTIICWGTNFLAADAPSGSFKAVTAGTWHACGLRNDGAVICWGRSFLAADAPSGSFKAVTAGTWHACGLRNDDTIVCWGNNDSGQADAPGGRFKDVSAGGGHSCGLRNDDTIVCWGNNDSGQADAPGGRFKAVSAGGWGHSCGLRTDDTMVCWGDSRFGQADAPGGRFKAVTAGGGHSCGLRTDDTIVCWGDSRFGQADAPGGRFKAVTAGGDHSCGLRNDDTIDCWGNNDVGQANAPEGNFQAIATGLQRSCGLRSDAVIRRGGSIPAELSLTIVCWGTGWIDYEG